MVGGGRCIVSRPQGTASTTTAPMSAAIPMSPHQMMRKDLSWVCEYFDIERAPYFVHIHIPVFMSQAAGGMEYKISEGHRGYLERSYSTNRRTR